MAPRIADGAEDLAGGALPHRCRIAEGVGREQGSLPGRQAQMGLGRHVDRLHQLMQLTQRQAAHGPRRPQRVGGVGGVEMVRAQPILVIGRRVGRPVMR